jgi:hypothetical protein
VHQTPSNIDHLGRHGKVVKKVIRGNGITTNDNTQTKRLAIINFSILLGSMDLDGNGDSIREIDFNVPTLFGMILITRTRSIIWETSGHQTLADSWRRFISKTVDRFLGKPLDFVSDFVGSPREGFVEVSILGQLNLSLFVGWEINEEKAITTLGFHVVRLRGSNLSRLFWQVEISIPIVLSIRNSRSKSEVPEPKRGWKTKKARAGSGSRINWPWSSVKRTRWKES